MITNSMARGRRRADAPTGTRANAPNLQQKPSADHGIDDGPIARMARVLSAQRPDPEVAVAHILQSELASAELLHGVRLIGSPERYTRNLVFSGPDFSVIAIVWMPGQMSPIHAHQSWCAFGLRNGSLVETCFTVETDPAEGRRQLRPAARRELHKGMVSHAPAGEQDYHRVANLGTEPAVSVHVYGLPFDRLVNELNILWND